jgi:hypothetical protein
MNPLHYLRDRIRGWLPQEPNQPEKSTKANLSRFAPPAPMLFRVSGLMLLAVGVFLLAMSLYSTLVLISGYSFLSNTGQLLPLTFIAGIAFAVIGMTLTAHSLQSNARLLRRPCLIAGLTLLTLSVFYSIFLVLEGMRMTATQYVAIIVPFQVYFSFAPFAGGLILFLGLHRWSALPSLLKKSYYAIAIGTAMSFVNSLISLLHLYPSSIPGPFSVLSELSNPALLFSFVLYPIGVICLILGWAGVFSISLKKHSFLLPTLFAIFLVIVLIMLPIPI